MLTKQNLSIASRRRCCKDKLSDHAKNLVFFLNNGLPIMWPAYLKISRKIPCFFFLEMVQLSDDLRILKFLEDSTLY
jgi:hypothetical protein